MLLDRIVKETTDISRVILPLDDWLDDTEVIDAIISADISLGTTGWANTPFPPYAAPPPYDPTPLLFYSYTMEADNRTLIVFVNHGTPGNTYTCTFVLAGTSARHFTFELGVEVSGTPPVRATVALPVPPTQGSWALPITGGTMTGPLYLSEDPLYPTEAATKNYVDAVSGRLGPYMQLSGGTMTGPLVLARDPQLELEPTTLQYARANYLSRFGGALFGAIYLYEDPASQMEPVTLQYFNAHAFTQTQGDGRYLQLAGGTLTGLLTLAADPVNPLDAVTKRYLLAELAQTIAAPLTFTYAGTIAASMARNVPTVIPLTIPAALAGTMVYATTAPTAAATFTVTRISGGVSTAVGTITITAGSHTVTTLAGPGTTMAAGDVLRIVGPGTADTTLADVTIAVLADRTLT